MGGCREGGATLFSGRHSDSTRGNTLKLEHGKISLDRGKKHSNVSVAEEWNSLSKEAVKSVQNTTGQFPEPPDLNRILLSVESWDYLTLQGSPANTLSYDAKTSLHFCQQMAISPKLHVFFQRRSVRATRPPAKAMKAVGKSERGSGPPRERLAPRLQRASRQPRPEQTDKQKRNTSKQAAPKPTAGQSATGAPKTADCRTGQATRPVSRPAGRLRGLHPQTPGPPFSSARRPDLPRLGVLFNGGCTGRRGKRLEVVN